MLVCVCVCASVSVLCYFCVHKWRQEEDIRCHYSPESGKPLPFVGVAFPQVAQCKGSRKQKAGLLACLPLLPAGECIHPFVVAAAAAAALVFDLQPQVAFSTYFITSLGNHG